MEKEITPVVETFERTNGDLILIIEPRSAVAGIRRLLQENRLPVSDSFIAGDLRVSGSIDTLRQALASAAFLATHEQDRSSEAAT